MRISYSVARHRAHKRLFREAKGSYGGRKNLLRTVKETVVRNRCFAYRDRRVRKREFRALWIIRVKAAAEMRGLSYSRFIYGLNLANISLNRTDKTVPCRTEATDTDIKMSFQHFHSTAKEISQTNLLRMIG